MISFDIVDEPDQKFSTVINNKRVTIRLKYNHIGDRYHMDLSIDDSPVIFGRKVVCGINLIEPYGLGIGYIFAHSLNGNDPTKSNIVSGLVKIYHASDDEVRGAAISS